MRILLALATCLILVAALFSTCAADWKPQLIEQLNGKADRIYLEGRIQNVTEKMDEVAAVPYIVYMPEKNEILMMIAYKAPHTVAFMSSKDGGATWSQPRPMQVGGQDKTDIGMGTSLTYLGKGKLMLYAGSRWFSSDYGETWGNPVNVDIPAEMKYWGIWDPPFVDKDPKTGKIVRIIETGYTSAMDTASGGAAQAYMRTSTDEGRTWGKAIKVPQWAGLNEVHIIRARNGDLVAACRTEVPKRFAQEIDHYEGLAVSISKDNGATWSEKKWVYEWGRHHPSMVVMKNGDIVMTYVVRKGYINTPDGFPQFGIEAIVSRDNGQTWDLDHKYILSQWKGNKPITDQWAWVASSQATSTVILPDGSLLTAFGTGYSAVPGSNPRDVGVVNWKLNYKGLNKDRIIRDAAFDSDLRNSFDPETPAGWKPAVIQQLNGKAPRIMLKGQIQNVSEKSDEVYAVPYIAYMPEKDEVLMMIAYGTPHMGAFLSSKDHGATWSKPWFLGTDAEGKPNVGWQQGLAYLGNGKLATSNGSVSEDYGRTWPKNMPVISNAKGLPLYRWDPMLVERDRKTGKVTRLTLEGYGMANPANAQGGAGAYSQGYISWSTDEGQTWSEPLKVPQWLGVSEVTFARAKNGDLIGACRTDIPAYFPGEGLDHYEGLAVSISKDNGATWSELNRLYDWGRHHPSMVVMKNGDIVMTYVVRKGYIDEPDGLPQFGIEAVVSRDNGNTWDLDHRYVLAYWKGNRTGSNAWFASSQATSTVILPDGSLLTAYGHGYSTLPDSNPRDVSLVHWKLNYRGLNKDRDIWNLGHDSDLRNKFDPAPNPKTVVTTGPRNIATTEDKPTVTSSKTDRPATAVLYDKFITRNQVSLGTIPGWIEIRWPKAYTISEVRILAGEPGEAQVPSGVRNPTEYQLQYDNAGQWQDLVPPQKQEAITNLPTGANINPIYTHRFAPVKTSAIRLYVTACSDTGKRLASPTIPIVPEGERETAIRGIEVIGE